MEELIKEGYQESTLDVQRCSGGLCFTEYIGKKLDSSDTCMLIIIRHSFIQYTLYIMT